MFSRIGCECSSVLGIADLICDDTSDLLNETFGTHFSVNPFMILKSLKYKIN